MAWSRGGRCIRFAALTVVGVFVGSWARADDLPYPLEPELTQAATLRFDYQPGTTVRYHTVIGAELKMADMRSNREVVRQLSATLELALVVQRRNDTSAFYTEELREVALELSEDGESVSARGALERIEGVVRSVELSLRGQRLDEERTEPPGSEVQWAVVLARSPGSLLEMELPDTPIEVGGSWVEEIAQAPTRGGPVGMTEGQSTGRVTYTLLGYGRVDGRTCAAIDVGYDVWVEIESAHGLGSIVGPFLGRAVGHGTVYFDTAAGRVVHATFDVGLVGQVQDASSPIDLTHTMSYALSLVP